MAEGAEDRREEAYKAFVARLKAEEAEESERRRQDGKVAVWLNRAPDDAETFTKELQAELCGVVDTLRGAGVDLEAPFMAVDSVEAVSGYTGQLIIELAQIASPVISVALVAWLKGRPGRKVRVEFHPSGRLKTIEAQTEDQVLSLLKAVKEDRAKTPKPEVE